MTSSDTVAWIASTLGRLGLREDENIDESTGLLGHGLGLDSVEVLRIVTAIENDLDLIIDDDDLHPEHFRSVGSLAAFMEERRDR